jgi:hypothetical protein
VNWILLYSHFAWTTPKTQPFSYWEGVFAAPMHSNGSYSIVVCVFFAVGMCLPSRSLATNIYSTFTIPASGPHNTILRVSDRSAFSEMQPIFTRITNFRI